MGRFFLKFFKKNKKNEKNVTKTTFFVGKFSEVLL